MESSNFWDDPGESLPIHYYQSGPVSCSLIFLSSILNEMLLTRLVISSGPGIKTKAKSIAAYSSHVLGHSQGVATAVCLSVARFAIKALWAVFRQGLLEQKHFALRHFVPEARSAMLALRGRPSAHLQSCMGGTANIVNSEKTVVCSGGRALQLVKKLGNTSVALRPLAIPFPCHAADATPALFALLDELRVSGFFAPRRTALTVHALPWRPSKPLDHWRAAAAAQLTTFLDFPSAVEGALAENTHVLDMGPTDNSIAKRLLADAGMAAPLVCGVAYPQADAGATPLLQRVLAEAREALGAPGIGAETSLAEYASSQSLSFLRSRLLERVPEFRSGLPASRFFSAGSVKAISMLVEDEGSAALPAIVHVSVYANKGTLYPLSFGQEQLLRVQTIAPSCVAYNCSASLWIAGGASPEKVRRCLTAIVTRHEVFSGLASPAGLRLLATTPSVSVVRVADEAAALARMGEVGRVPFRLGEEASLRAEVLVTPSGLLLLAIWVHHMNFDILSQGVLHSELRTMLMDKPLPELPVQYVDFSLWSRRVVTSGLIDARGLVAELAPHAARFLDMPLDRPRPRQWSFSGDRVVTFLEKGEVEGATPFTAHLAAFFMLLWKCSGQEALVVGVPYHGRERACLEPLCGYFINMLPVLGVAGVRTTVAGALAEARERWQRALDSAAVPFLSVVDGLNKLQPPDASRNPVFQAMLNYRAESLKRVADARFRPQPVHQLEGHMDLDLQVDTAEGGVAVALNYCTSLFEARTAERFAAQYAACFQAIGMSAWRQVEMWRLPAAPRLLRDVQEAEAVSLERAARKLTPLIAEMGQPIVAGGPQGLRLFVAPR